MASDLEIARDILAALIDVSHWSQCTDCQGEVSLLHLTKKIGFKNMIAILIAMKSSCGLRGFNGKWIEFDEVAGARVFLESVITCPKCLPYKDSQDSLQLPCEWVRANNTQ